MGGMVVETNQTEILTHIEAQQQIEKKEAGKNPFIKSSEASNFAWLVASLILSQLSLLSIHDLSEVLQLIETSQYLTSLN